MIQQLQPRHSHLVLGIFIVSSVYGIRIGQASFSVSQFSAAVIKVSSTSNAFSVSSSGRSILVFPSTFSPFLTLQQQHL
jgi:hypothetical protein